MHCATAPQWTSSNSVSSVNLGRLSQIERWKTLTVERVKVPPGLTSWWPFKYPSLIPERIRIQCWYRKDGDVEQQGNGDDVTWEEELGRDTRLEVEQHYGQHQRYHPERHGIGPEETVERVEIVLETPTHPRRHFEACGNEEPTDAADAANQDVTWYEPDNVAEFELAHQIEDGAGKHSAQGVRGDCCGNHSIWAVFPYESSNSEGHVVEEGDNFDLASNVSRPG